MKKQDFERMLSSEQQRQIVNTIERQIRMYLEYDQKANEFFYEPYTSMRKSYSLTAAILSGFSSKHLSVEGLCSCDMYYGLKDKLCQPELSCDHCVFQIYSSGSSLNGNPVLKRAKQLNSRLQNTPLFFVIVFSTTKQSKLKSVVARIPDSRGKMIDEYRMYP